MLWSDLMRLSVCCDRVRQLISLTAVLVVVGGCAVSGSRVPDDAVFNAHMHAAYLGMDDAAYLEDVLGEMDATGIRRSVLHLNETSDVADWVDRAPTRFSGRAGVSVFS